MRLTPYLGAVSSLLALGAFSALGAPPTSIVLDGSLGHAAGAVNPTSPGFYEITPSMGKSLGANLFQSFGTFNLGTGDTADFEANPGTQNIIARVTGGSASSIDGTITSTVGPGGPLSGANLFLLNPAGIMFGANAQINLTGALTVSTASYAKLSDGTVFYADTVHPINDAGLTSAPISAFGFLGATPQPVTFSGTQMGNSGGIHVIGGDITLDGASLLAAGGNLTLFSAASAGEVPFSLASPGSGFGAATNTAFGNITMQNGSKAAIDSAQGGGSIVIRGGKMVVDNSTVSSTNSGPTAGGSISVQAEDLEVQDAGQIIAGTTGAGNAGNVSIAASTVTVDGTNGPAPGSSAVDDQGITGIFSQTEIGATGNAGAVTVADAGQMSLLGGGTISGTSFSAGNGGNVMVQAASLTIDGASSYESSSVCSNAFGTGNAGEITVQAAWLTISAGSNPSALPGIFSQAETGITGNAGKVYVDVTGDLQLLNQGGIASGSFGSGDGGDVTVRAGSMEMEGSATGKYLTGITSQANPGATGNGGDVNVTVATALTINGASADISSSNFGPGNAGDVNVQAGSMTITTTPTQTTVSGVLSDAESVGTGNGGDVNVNVAGNLTLSGQNALISSGTSGQSNAGVVNVQAGSLRILKDWPCRCQRRVSRGSVPRQE